MYLTACETFEKLFKEVLAKTKGGRRALNCVHRWVPLFLKVFLFQKAVLNMCVCVWFPKYGPILCSDKRVDRFLLSCFYFFLLLYSAFIHVCCKIPPFYIDKILSNNSFSFFGCQVKLRTVLRYEIILKFPKVKPIGLTIKSTIS